MSAARRRKVPAAVEAPAGGLELRYVRLGQLVLWEGNPKLHDQEAILESVYRHGFKDPPKFEPELNGGTGGVVEGNGRASALARARDEGREPPRGVAVLEGGEWAVPVLFGVDAASQAEAEAYGLAHNVITVMGGNEPAAALEAVLGMSNRQRLAELMQRQVAAGAGVPLHLPSGLGPGLLQRLEAAAEQAEAARQESRAGELSRKFVLPPFSVLDARQGAWQDRKRLWLELGIRSETGRASGLLQGMSNAEETWNAVQRGKNRKHDEAYEGGFAAAGTSVFDPVLCELVYRWFCPPGGEVLDPFAGGSVRGVVASLLGRRYTGVDLRGEQIEANLRNWQQIRCGSIEEVLEGPEELTPVERLGEVWVKRDDRFEYAGVRGGKVRSALAIAAGAEGVVTAGARKSPQVAIVAEVARALGIPCRAHTASGASTAELEQAEAAGAEVVRHRPGHNSVIVARAREDATARGWREVPFGMECEEAVEQTAVQVANLPAELERLVVPVGSGMSLAGILHGLRREERELPVLGVVVGADPRKRLERWAPVGWEDLVELVEAGEEYSEEVEPYGQLGGLPPLDPVYEAKCVPYLRPGDCLWIVGRRQELERKPLEGMEAVEAPRWLAGDSRELGNLVSKRQRYDLVFTCPPYGSLERYSTDPADLSNMEYSEFVEGLREIVAAAVSRLRNHRFACCVVGDFRRPDGSLHGLELEVVRAFEDAGAALYNDAVLVTAVGSLPLRVSRHFPLGRKLGRSHQYVLVFCKGEWRKAVEACGEVDVALPVDLEEARDES